MKKPEVDVSFVMTVYNKEYYLPSVLKALLNQTGLRNPEFIFVDDVSTDRSVEIIKEATKNVPNVTIVINKQNKGIAPTTNQGLKLAVGKYVRLLDSDDILPINSTEKMLILAELHEADMVYGCFRKTGKEPEELEKEKLENFTYKYHYDALDTVLGEGHFVRMGQLISNETLRKAKGADERVFIQDESIAVRSAIKAHGLVKVTVDVLLVPKEFGNFSGNKLQLDHDRFLAYAYAILDNPALPKKYLRKMYKKCVSAYWKMTRKTKLLPFLTGTFFYYLASKVFPVFSVKKLNKMKDKFLALQKVRRINQ